MLPVRRFVLATDEKELSAEVWREACTLAGLLDAEVVPVHVTMEDARSLPALAARIGDRLTGAPKVARTEVHLYRPGASVADAVLSAAKDHSADMIVLGAGEKSTLDRVFLGSTAEAVSRRASVPVWAVRPSQVPRKLETILCAVDRSPAARAALAGAIDVARTAKAKLVALAVVAEGEEGVDPVLVMELELRDFLAGMNQEGVDLWVEVLKGDDPVDEILKQVELTSCDVLVLGQAGRAGFQRLWDANTADSLLRTVPCSLLTIHPPNGEPA